MISVIWVCWWVCLFGWFVYCLRLRLLLDISELVVGLCMLVVGYLGLDVAGCYIVWFCVV